MEGERKRKAEEAAAAEMTEILGATLRGDLDRGQNLYDVRTEVSVWASTVWCSENITFDLTPPLSGERINELANRIHREYF